MAARVVELSVEDVAVEDVACDETRARIELGRVRRAGGAHEHMARTAQEIVEAKSRAILIRGGALYCHSRQEIQIL